MNYTETLHGNNYLMKESPWLKFMLSGSLRIIKISVSDTWCPTKDANSIKLIWPKLSSGTHTITQSM